MTTGQRIRKLRLERDWTQEELGQKAGINFRNISRYESDRLRAGLKILKKLAGAFGISVDELAGNEEQGEPSHLFRDHELLRQVREIEKMDEEDRAAVKRILQAMIIKHQVQNLGQIA